MSGIVGIWNIDGQPLERGLLAKLSATMSHRGPDGEGIWVQGSVGMACQHLQVTPESIGQPQPLVHPSGIAIVFDGRLDNREELLQNPEISEIVSAKAPDTEFILAVYRIYGDTFPAKLNGDFALAIYDPNLQRLILARDAIGIRPLYFHRAEGLFIFSTEIKALLAHPRVSASPNDNVLANYVLGTGGNGALDGATLFEGIFSVLPAHTIVQTPDRCETKRYWDFDPMQKTRFKTFPEYAEAFHYYFEQAVQRRLRSSPPVAVSVSGGLDSSSIFCVAETLRRSDPKRFPSLKGISYISSDGGPADERVFLQDIEREYGVTIDRFPLCSSGFFDESKKRAWYMEDPLINPQSAASDIFFERCRQSDTRIVLNGLWGDQMLGSTAYLFDLVRQLAWGKVLRHRQELPQWTTDVSPEYWQGHTFLRDLFRYHIPEASIPVLRKIRNAFGRAPYSPGRDFYTKKLWERVNQNDIEWANQSFKSSCYASCLYYEVRSSYYIRCMELENKVTAMYGLEIAFPFLDRDLLSFLMSIPGEIPSWDGVHRGLLRAAMAGVIPNSIEKRRWKADFTSIGNAGVSLDYPKLEDFFEIESLGELQGYLHQDLIRQEISYIAERVNQSTNNIDSKSLLKLFGLEQWLRTFFK